MPQLSTLLVVLGLTSQLTSTCPTSHARRSENATQPAVTVNPALWDGLCTYPVADVLFPTNLTEYTGRWYQVAGTPQPFTASCKCIYAEYGLNSNGTVSVNNVCQLPGERKNVIQGTAAPVDPAYGTKGAFQVRFPSVPGEGLDECQGPNYIVQRYDPNWAIVQAPSWRALFILSRVQKPEKKELAAWVEVAGRLGTNRTAITLVDQDNCKFI